jgi:hypothetical protein
MTSAEWVLYWETGFAEMVAEVASVSCADKAFAGSSARYLLQGEFERHTAAVVAMSQVRIVGLRFVKNQLAFVASPAAGSGFATSREASFPESLEAHMVFPDSSSAGRDR